MVRAQRAKRIKKPQTKEQYDSDDPEGYKDMPVPDKKSAKYSKDKIDTFHDEKISDLLARGVQMDSEPEDTDEEEEVLPLDVSDSEDDDDEEEQGEESDMESDLEGKKDDDLPNDQAWGNRKKMFYDSDYTAAKGKTQEQVEAEDAEEEEEAKNIQKRLAADMSEEDYDLNLLQEFAVEEKEVGQKERIVKDLKEMSQKEKMKLLKKESPELLELIADFKAKLAELKDELQPLLMMVEDGRIPPGKGANYLKTKQMLYQNYCTNISFYLVLKAKRIPAHNHPVIERLVTYRNLINELKAVDARLAPQLRLLLSGEAVPNGARRAPGCSGKETKRDKVSEESGLEAAEDSDLDEEAALLFYKQVEDRMKHKRKIKTLQPGESLAEGEDDEEMDDVAKRGITYEMAKNKGLTPKRKKINRNPRVKHKEKFRRAKIRRKGQVREVHQETTRYSGEASGIRAGVKKSVKLK